MVTARVSRRGWRAVPRSAAPHARGDSSFLRTVPGIAARRSRARTRQPGGFPVTVALVAVACGNFGLFEVNRGGVASWLLSVALRKAVTSFSPGAAGAGGADAAPLAGGVAEAVGVAGFELGDAVEAFGAGTGYAGQDGGDDPVLPAGDGAGEHGQPGGLLVLGAPVGEGKEPVPGLPLARDRAGDAGAEAQCAAELFLAGPGQRDVLAGAGGVRGLDDLAELLR